MTKLSFRQFLELQQVEPNYLDKLKDELDVDPSSISDNPQWLANATLGSTTFSGLTYSLRYVKNGAGEIIGAMVKPLVTKRAYVQDKEGRYVRDQADRSNDGKEYFVTKDQLNKMLNQEAQPGAAAGAAGAGGMPAGGMPGMQ